MNTLGIVSTGRDNNLNLIRAIAAVAVLVSHAYPIASGPGTSEPLHASLDHTLGTIAVYVFFVISGFLITMSFARTDHAGWFSAARAVRLMPGLIVSIVSVAFVMGVATTTLPWQDYLTHSDTYSFIIRNITMAFPQYTLPGVFDTNPFPTVEGSIWTLFYEVVCYIGVFVFGIIGLLRHRGWTAAIVLVFIVTWIIKEGMGAKFFTQIEHMFDLGVPFALGTVMYLWRDKIPMSLIGVALTAALAWGLSGTALYDIAFHLALAYAVFWLAFIPGGWIRAYNRLGDYSYGIYIYAFPMQGLAVWLFGPQTPLMNMAIALPMTLVPSILSWHFVEQPCLNLLKRAKRI